MYSLSVVYLQGRLDSSEASKSQVRAASHYIYIYVCVCVCVCVCMYV